MKKPTPTQLNRFYKQNPGFDLNDFALNKQVEVDNLNWKGIKRAKETILQSLKIDQRLARITPNTAVAAKLKAQGFHAALQIAALSEIHFVRKVSRADLNGSRIDAKAAQAVHQQAVDRKQRILLTYTNLRNTVGAPHYRASRFYQSPKALEAEARSLPSYNEIFGSLDYCECPDCRSQFSPAAYYYELMDLVEEYITAPNEERIPTGYSLKERRPDLFDLPLDCEQTVTDVIYLEVVNRILKARIEGLESGEITNAYEHLGINIYPFQLPFHQPLEQIRMYLGHLGKSMAEVYQVFQMNDAAMAREMLNLSLEEEGVFLKNTVDSDSINSAYGMTTIDVPGRDLGGLDNTVVFLQQTGISFSQLEEILHQNLSEEERDAQLHANFFVNWNDEKMAMCLSADGSLIDNMQVAGWGTGFKPNRLHRLIRMTNKLQWSLTNLSWALQRFNPRGSWDPIEPTTTTYLSHLQTLIQKTNLPLEQLCIFEYDIKTFGRGNTAVSEALFDRIFNQPTVFNPASTYPYRPIYTDCTFVNNWTFPGNTLFTSNPLLWNTADREEETQKAYRLRLAAALGITDDDLSQIASYVIDQSLCRTDDLESLEQSEANIALTVQNLSLLYRFALAARMLKLRVSEYFLLLDLLEEVQMDTAAKAVNALEQVAWIRQSGFNIYELHAIVTGIPNDYVNLGYKEADLPALLTEMAEAAPDQPGSLPAPANDLRLPTLVNGLSNFFGSDTQLMKSALGLTGLMTGHESDYIVLLLVDAVDANGNVKADVSAFIEVLAYNLLMAQKLNFTATELQSVVDTPNAYGISEITDGFKFTFPYLQTFYTFKQLTIAFNDTEDELIGVFKLTIAKETEEALAALANWETEQLNKLVLFLGLGLESPTVTDVKQLNRCFTLAVDTGMDISALIAIAELHDKGINQEDGALETDHWFAHQNASTNLLQVINAKYDEESWPGIYGPINEHLQAKQRDALAPFLAWRLREDTTYPDIEQMDDLYPYLLTDVEMGGCTHISPLKEGLNALQLYIQRCRGNLEPGATSYITDAWWEWMSQYRLWEANQKVFNYPENYIEPELRTRKTAPYQKLQEKLLQGEITEGRVAEAYNEYFDQFTEEAGLKIADAYYAGVDNIATGTVDDTLFLFGRTRSTPYTFYYRKAIMDTTSAETIQQPEWYPWQKIDLTINAKEICPLYALDRLFIFWVEQMEVTKSQSSDGNSQEATGAYATIRYSFYNVSGQWVQPQTLAADILIKVDSELNDDSIIEALFPEYDASWMKETDTQAIFWQKVYPLRIPKKSDQAEQVLVVYGEMDLQEGSPFEKYIPKLAGFVLNADLRVYAMDKIIFLANDNFQIALIDKPELRIKFLEYINLFCYDFYVNKYIVDQNANEGSTFKALLEKISPNYERLISVKNQPGWYLFDNGNETQLIITFSSGNEPQPQRLTDGLTIEMEEESSLQVSYTFNNIILSSNKKFLFIRLTTDVIGLFSSKVFSGGHKNMLTLETQYTKELSFSRLSPNPDIVLSPPDNDTIDFYGAYGQYFWELFYHTPFLIANTLNAHQKYQEAQQWYHAVFNPTLPPNLIIFNPDVFNPIGSSKPPTSYWPLNEGQDSVATDKVGESDGEIIGTLNWEIGSDFPDGNSRNLLKFNGTDNYIKVDNTTNLSTNQFTIYFWVKKESNNQSSQYILEFHNSNKGYSFTTSELQCFFSLDSLVPILESYDNIELGKWVHIAVTYNGETAKFYINGKLQSSQTGNFSPDPDGPLNFGASLVLGDVFGLFEGYIADISIWEEAQTEEEITSSFYSSYWQFRPFLEWDGNEPELGAEAIYGQDPFDPHAIARLRPDAYPKATVMHYIDNLLDWGDACFAQDSWESLVQATLLYVSAQDLLGPRPVQRGSCELSESQSWSELNLPTLADAPEAPDSFMLELEQALRPLKTKRSLPETYIALNDYFCMPENQDFIAYWDRVEDRLYKVRHCMNLSGQTRELSLFQPPIDPRQLVSASASGQDITQIAAASILVPPYRFSYMMSIARDVTNSLMQLGSALLASLEKQDAEALGMLHTGQESQLLNMVTDLKGQQIEEARQNIVALQESLAAARFRHTYYQELLNQGLLASEKEATKFLRSSVGMLVAANAIRAIAVGTYLIPNIYGVAGGGMQFGDSTEMGAAINDGIVNILQQESAMSQSTADFERREEEWELQRDLANYDAQQIAAQIAAVEIQVEMAEKDLEVHQQSIANAQEVEDFLKRKFTNKELYTWMGSRVSSTYFQSYQLALDLARSVEAAYQYERDTNNSIIRSTHWDNMRQGLLAGETLMFNLQQLENAYIKDNVRELEIEKTISLLELNPQALLNLKNDGTCIFDLTEQLFDYDFPGHYCRKIKTLSISIPAVVGPYQNVQATLTQQQNRTLLQANEGGVQFLLGEDVGQPDSSVLRSDYRNMQQIAISRGINDAGQFELNFHDERYLPFEGTGAVSSWQLDMPKAANRIDFATITDVIIHLKYTAYNGGDNFRTTVTGLGKVSKYQGTRTISLAQEYATAWYAFLNGGQDAALLFPLREAMFRANMTELALGDEKGEVLMFVQTKNGTDSPALSLNGQEWDSDSGKVLLGDSVTDPVSFETLSNPCEIKGTPSPEEWLDIILVIPYQGQLAW